MRKILWLFAVEYLPRLVIKLLQTIGNPPRWLLQPQNIRWNTCRRLNGAQKRLVEHILIRQLGPGWCDNLKVHLSGNLYVMKPAFILPVPCHEPAVLLGRPLIPDYEL